ncbi:LysR family transcriptional regulator [Aerococcus urinaeequi]|uniref:LysR family transcriptional regulator n=1 Tax=Aerococcus urinaeequi TaxID=51665 RepID=UPI003AAC3B58
MYIEKLKYFIDLYECGNFTETARKNFISQASVSQYITALENEFQTSLFNRHVTPIQPTEQGKYFYEQAQILLHQYQNMQQKMADFSTNTLPTLKLAYTSYEDLSQLISFMSYLKEKESPLRFELVKISCKDVDYFVQNEVCDMALSFLDEFQSKDLSTFTITKGQYQAVVPKAHPLFENEVIALSDLYEYPLVLLSEERMGPNTFALMQERSQRDGYKAQIAKTIEDFESAFFYVISENLIGFVTEEYDMSRYGDQLKKIPLAISNHTYEIVLGYRTDTPNPAIHYFIQELTSYHKI